MSNRSILIIFVAVTASLLEIIDTSIVNVALPTMMGNLGATLEDISMVITGYTVANAIVLPVSGWLGERIGRRKYYLGCIAIFTLTSVACGFAPNLYTLIVFRILQGLVGGALLPTSQTLIYEQFPKEKAGTAGAVFGMSVMIGPALGPVLGGYLTDNFGWRSIFNINFPVGIIALFVGLACIYNPERSEEERAKSQAPLDSVGLALLVLGIGCLQFLLERGEPDDWFSSKLIIANAVITAVCLPLFVWWELRVKHPILNIRLFKESIVTYGVVLMGCLGFFLYGLVFILPVFVGRAFHYDATQTGELFIPGSILTAFMMPVVGKRLQAGVNPKILIFIGLICIDACLILMTQFSPFSERSEIMRMLYVRGFAMAFLFIPINSSILSQFKGPTMGQVAGFLNLSRQIGGSFGIALIGTLFSVRSQQNYLDLVSNVSLLKPSTQQVYYSSVNALSHKMTEAVGMSSAVKATLQSLYYRVQAQVFMLTFNQLTYVMMIIFSVSFIALWRLRFKAKTNQIVDAH